VQVLGISTDSVESHKKFCDSLELPFPLLADTEGKVSKLYGIVILTAKNEPLSGRSVFLIDQDGIVEYADSKYDLRPETDHDALLKAVESPKKRAPAAP
jgi:peroxiredoxin Q/BCP